MSFPEEDFFDFIDKLRKEHNSIIIVEGLNDKKALETWDINLPIENIKHPWFEFIENIMDAYPQDTKIILLLDADPQGRKYQKKLKNEFRKYGFTVDSSYWSRMQHFHITYIEGLTSSNFLELRLKYLSMKIDNQEKPMEN